MTVRVSIEIDPVTDDIAIPVVFIRGLPAVSQKLQNRFHFFKGEWHLDLRQGLPWYQRILGKIDNKIVAKFILKETIRTCPGILSVRKFVILEKTSDGEGRLWELNFEAVTTDQQVFVSQAGEFIIRIPGIPIPGST